MKPEVTTVVMMLVLAACSHEPPPADLAKITVVEHAVTANDKPAPFAHADALELRFDVTVRDVPKGASVDLTCDWTDPAGARVHQNHWSTKAMDHDPWPTHCRYPLTAASATGKWTVTMKQGDRVLASDAFDVR